MLLFHPQIRLVEFVSMNSVPGLSMQKGSHASIVSPFIIIETVGVLSIIMVQEALIDHRKHVPLS